MQNVVFIIAGPTVQDDADEMAFVADGDALHSIERIYCTHTSLAAVGSSRYLKPARTEFVGTTLKQAFSDSGCACVGLKLTPQMSPTFGSDAAPGLYKRAYKDDSNALGRLISGLKRFLRRSDCVYRQLKPVSAVLKYVSADISSIDVVIKRFNATDQPRLLWLSLRETHRSYHRGESGVPEVTNEREQPHQTSGYVPTA
jgi:hypothetical protein